MQNRMKSSLKNIQRRLKTRTAAGATDKLPEWEKPRAKNVAWSYDMEGHARKCVARYCELATKKWSSYTQFQVLAWMITISRKRKLNQLESYHLGGNDYRLAVLQILLLWINQNCNHCNFFAGLIFELFKAVMSLFLWTCFDVVVTTTRLLRRFRHCPGRLLCGERVAAPTRTALPGKRRIELFDVFLFIVELLVGDAACLSSQVRASHASWQDT